MYIEIEHNIISLDNIQSIRGFIGLKTIEIKYHSGWKDRYDFYSEKDFENAYQLLADNIKNNKKQEG